MLFLSMSCLAINGTITKIFAFWFWWKMTAIFSLYILGITFVLVLLIEQGLKLIWNLLNDVVSTAFVRKIIWYELSRHLRVFFRGNSFSPGKALDLVRAALQPSLNAELESVLKTYQEVLHVDIIEPEFWPCIQVNLRPFSYLKFTVSLPAF